MSSSLLAPAPPAPTRAAFLFILFIFITVALDVLRMSRAVRIPDCLTWCGC